MNWKTTWVTQLMGTNNDTDQNNMADIYECMHDFFIEDAIVLNVLRKYEKRSEQGMKDYGVSLKDNKEDLMFFLTQAQEEAMDLSLYLEKIMTMLAKEDK